MQKLLLTKLLFVVLFVSESTAFIISEKTKSLAQRARLLHLSVDPERLAWLISPDRKSKYKSLCSAKIFYFTPCDCESRAFNSWAQNKKDSPLQASPFEFVVESTDIFSNSFIENLEHLSKLANSHR